MANEYKLSYTAADINKKLGQIESLASKDEVPTKLSDLVDDKGYLTLTTEGLKIAKKIYERHVVLTEALMELGVDMKTAEEDACRIEHVISDKTFKALKKHRKVYGGK